MKCWGVLWALLLLMLAGTQACADGRLIVPSAMLGRFFEQAQVAVVEVKADKTATVDLFISLHDTSGKQHTVYHFLPLQTLPKAMKVTESTLGDFRQSKLSPLDRIYTTAAGRREELQKTINSSCLLGSVFGGPGTLALIGSFSVGGHRGMLASADAMGQIAAPQATLSVTTKHSRIDVYRSLNLAEVTALTKVADVPSSVGKTLRQYAGKPFALMTLKTIPSQVTSQKVEWVNPREAFARQPGLHISFAQALITRGADYRYDYPLGTGQGWTNPIPLTQVYVTAADSLPLHVRFPGQKTWTKSLPKAAFTVLGGATLGAAADGKQVMLAQYDNSNEKNDITITLASQGESEFAAEQRMMRLKLVVPWILFPLLGCSVWLGSMALVGRKDSYLQTVGFHGAFWRGWLGMTVLLFPLFMIFAVWDQWYVMADPSWASSRLWVLTFRELGVPPGVWPILVILLGIFSLIPMWWVARLLARKWTGKFLAKVTGAMILSGVVYTMISALVMWVVER